MADKVNIGEEARSHGDFNLNASEQPKLPENAMIENFNFNKADNSEENTTGGGFDISSIIAYVFSTVVLALLILKFIPEFKNRVENYEISNFVKNGLWGLGLVIALPIISIILFCIIIGVRIGVVLLLFYVIALMIATPLASIIIGLLVAKKQQITENKKIILYIAIVSLIVSILEVIPVISGIVMILFGLVGFGTIFVLPFSKKLEVKE